MVESDLADRKESLRGDAPRTVREAYDDFQALAGEILERIGAAG